MPRLITTISGSYVPQQVTLVPSFARNITFFGYSGFNASGIPVNNSATVYVSNIASGECAMSVGAGSSFQYTVTTTAERENLANYWINGKALDGCYIIYN